MMKFPSFVLSFMLFALSVVAPSADAKPVYNKAIYDPASKSYFVLHKVSRVENPAAEIPDVTFEQAEQFASSRVFKGVRGRLAIVKSNETHLFLMQNFRTEVPAWIGLRYYCKLRQLKWVNGEQATRASFNAWDRMWDQAGSSSCVNGNGDADWMGVSYTPADIGFRWAAKGAAKRYTAYFIEYPTGEP